MPKTKKRSLNQQRIADRLRKHNKRNAERGQLSDATLTQSTVPVGATETIGKPDLSQVKVSTGLQKHTDKQYTGDEKLHLEQSRPCHSEQTTSIQAQTDCLHVAQYSPSALAALVGDHVTEIPDDIIVAALNLLKSVCNNELEPYVGYFTPAEIMCALSVNNSDMNAVVKQCLPDGLFSVNIHPLQGHWVTSCYFPQTNIIHVYDSLMSSTHYQQVIPQLKLVYGEKKTTNVIYRAVTQQGHEPLCGVMAICFAFSAFLGHDPGLINYDISKARHHLKKCFLQGELIPFPEISTDSCKHSKLITTTDTMQEAGPTYPLYTATKLTVDPLPIPKVCKCSAIREFDPQSSNTLLQCYLRDQQKKQSEKRKENSNKVDSTMQSPTQTCVLRTDNLKFQSSHNRDRLKEREYKRRSRSKKTVHMKEREKQKEKLSKQKSRKDSSVREREKIIEKQCKLKRRADSSVREKEKEKEKLCKRKSRKDSSVREREKDTEKQCKLKRRADSSVREKEKEKEKLFKRKSRKDSSVREREKNIDKQCKLKRRADSSAREKEKEKEKLFKRKSRKDSSVREREKNIDKQCKLKRRADSSVREKEKEKEKLCKRKSRKDSSVREREKDTEKQCKLKRRADSSVREKEKEKEKLCKRKRRKDSSVRERERQKEANLKRQSRTLSSEENIAIEAFKTAIEDGPTYICTVCNRLLFKNTVSQFDISKFKDSNVHIVENCRTKKSSPDGIEYICSSCKLQLQKGYLPSLSVCNGLNLDDIPQPLKDLNTLETTFIARRIPFMKLLALPRGKQRAVHGCVVNIPVEPTESVSVLPRVPSSDTFIPVKLKRALKYRGHVYSQNIRPQKVKDALYILKHNMNNKLYSDIIIDDEWDCHCNNTNPELWTCLTNEPLSDDNTNTAKSPEESDGNKVLTKDTDDGENNHTETQDTDDQVYDEIEDERAKFSGVPLDTCLQEKDLTENNLVLNIAPGEGKKPVSMETDQNCEELFFPVLFPSGKFGFSYQRPRKVTLKRYFQTRLLNSDRRFAANTEYIFYAQYRCESKDIKDSLSVSLRKGKQADLNAGQVKQKMSDYIRNDLGLHFLQKVRGSPAFFNKLLLDLLGMIRQLGACTWFITLSAADLKWTDTLKIIARQQGTVLSNEEVLQLSWEDRSSLLRSDPVTAARHFNNRVQMFLKHILLNKNLNPLGEILDYKYRIEFQQRGSPHVHMLAWVKDAPTFDDNTEAEVKAFVDCKITCCLPHDDQGLREQLLLVQRHSHSIACRKHGKNCRFYFPRYPLFETIAVKPSGPLQQNMQEYYSEVLQAVHDQLTDLDHNTDITLNTLLQNAGVSENVYINALKWIKTKGGQPAVILKRSPAECLINHYNKTLMNGWEANLDVQFVTNVYACVMYVASYISKPEKTLGDVLKAVSSSSEHLGAKASMKSVAKKFLTHREVSAQEAVYRLLSLPLTQGSREVVFIHTDFPDNRTRLFKPMKVIENMEDDDPNVFMLGLLNRYQARPDYLNDLCLASFAAYYRSSYKQTKDEENIDDDAQNIDDDAQNSHYDSETEHFQDVCPKSIHLKNNMGNMSKRKKAAIVRYHQWSQKTQPEQYYHAQLMLYFPWRIEITDLFDQSYEKRFQAKLDIIKQNRALFEQHTDHVSSAIENLEKFGPQEESWDVIAPQAQQARADEFEEGAEILQGVGNAYDTSDERHAARDIGILSHEYELTTEKMSNRDWYDLILSLNGRQAEVHQFIVQWCSKMILSHRIEKPPPFHIFLTGGAGVGKSHLVRTIVQSATRLFSRNNQAQDTQVLVCAPTGAAAYNIAGYTLHAAFQLPVRQSSNIDYIPLRSESLAALKDAIGDIKILIIDEISMVGADMLLTIHRRLCDVMASDEPFGGVSVIAVGDLLQLKPVAQKNVFEPPSDQMAAIYGSLWKIHFKIVELTEIQRQKNDQQFASLLNRVRIGTQTVDDIALLNSRQTSPGAVDYPAEATHAFTSNAAVDDHNTKTIDKLMCTTVVIHAKDSQRDDQTGRIVTGDFSNKAGGLLKSIKLAIGAKVILTKNIDVQDGLVNSATGEITGFYPPLNPSDQLDNFNPKYIFIKFHDTRVGKMRRKNMTRLLRDENELSTPIERTETPVRVGSGKSSVTGKRLQFPVTLAWGVTIHKEQGKTEDQLVISCNGSYQGGQFYTAISRTRDLSGLFLLGEVKSKHIKVNKSGLAEIERMKTNSVFAAPVPTTFDVEQHTYFKLYFHNVNSLNAHFSSFSAEPYLKMCHVTCLVETWLQPDDVLPDIPSHAVLRRDHPSQHRSSGVLMYINYNTVLLQERTIPNHALNHQIVILQPKQYQSLRIIILSIYKHPRTSMQVFLRSLEELIQALPQAVHTIITGDFNIDTYNNNSTCKDFTNLLHYYHFQPCFNTPTHRKGGVIDNIYVNFDPAGIITDLIPTYYSDHFVLGVAIPFHQF